MDGVFLCYTASANLGNKKASLHWARKGLDLATLARGKSSKYAQFFEQQVKNLDNWDCEKDDYEWAILNEVHWCDIPTYRIKSFGYL